MGRMKKEDAEKLKKQREGEIWTNNDGYKMKIINYDTYKRVTVEFLDDRHYKTTTSYGDIIRGNVKNLEAPTVYGVGIIGNKYPSRDGNKMKKEYTLWINMLKRCYDTIDDVRNRNYFKCNVCDEWKYYPNFYEWVHNQENFEKWLNGDFAIDKDIIKKHNKIYSPDTCCLVPRNINILFVKNEANRGDTPIGVTYHKRDHVYEAHCGNPYEYKKSVYLGRSSSPTEAFNIYKKYKELLIKKIAKEEYNKGNIIQKCYEAMINYKVEITD